MRKKSRKALFALLLSASLTMSCTSQSTSSPPAGLPVKEKAKPEQASVPPLPPAEKKPPAQTAAQPILQAPPVKQRQSSYYVDLKNYRIHPTNPDSPEKIALLTFDDGPKGKVTKQILDTLDKYQVKSIWFINGFNYGWDYKPDPSRAETFKELVKEIQARGHIVANHTWEHENLRKLAPDKQRKEILSMNELIQDLTGEKPKYFRPPFGAYTDVQKQVMKEEGMQWMNWSVGSLDWEYKDPQQVVNQVTSSMHNGAVILMHDFPVTAEALEPILKQLTEMGYKFVLPTEIRSE